MKNILTVVVISFLLVGCGKIPSPPDESIKKCLEKGWQPEYHATHTFVLFNCNPIIDKSNKTDSTIWSER